MAAIGNLPPMEESTRRIFASTPYYQPLGWGAAMTMVGRYSYEKKQAILARLLAEGVIGYVHTIGTHCSVVGVEDFSGSRSLDAVAMVYLGENNEPTVDREKAQKVIRGDGRSTWIFLMQPVKGMGLIEFEDACKDLIEERRAESVRNYRAHNASPAGQAEKAIARGLHLSSRPRIAMDEEYMEAGTAYVTMTIPVDRLEHLVRVLEAHPYGA